MVCACVDNGKPSGCVNPICKLALWEYFVRLLGVGVLTKGGKEGKGQKR